MMTLQEGHDLLPGITIRDSVFKLINIYYKLKLKFKKLYQSQFNALTFIIFRVII